MENFEPKNSRGMIVSGFILIYFLAPIVLAIYIPMAGTYGGHYAGTVGIFFGIGLAVVGLVLLIVGMLRVLRTIDFLGRKAASQGAWA